ncbi:aldehyde dehydrogenase [Acidithiobacillus ferrooxidans]|uniref:aldehyde dehydrogenase n=1 Tax=Acidithiobacillus ferrooxidans TaxID=920 RepID=UPI001C078B21|nr:aldehyde dehydrogenase [Acidithiobacillus ferrooxidans]MBU2856096.1 aldehyde dehydrogenase [Acidithiobacillus ferrooxidans]MBU2861447.1 aldehyde dehydrogenase [Acidithiobacillus ferrooxidans]MDA8375664.1 aldehyde dehydrogenase [Planctomycetia bacterium]
METFPDKAYWSAKAAQMKFPTQLFIDGKWQDAVSRKRFPSVNPATGALLTEVAEADSADVNIAVANAREAFEDGRWSQLPPRERGRRLIRLAEIIERHREELALMETLDVGKPIHDSYHIDMAGIIRTFAWHGEATDKVYDEIAPTEAGSIGMITREPLGVVAAVVPWNFPLDMAAWKVAPALAAGNSVILKPAEQSPLTALRLAELALDAGIPAGILNVLPGYGPTAGKALGLHPDVDCLAFTGSTEVGKLFLQYSGQSNMKRVWLECGGKSPNIIFADCDDLDAAAQAAAMAIFFNQGEVCSAGSRLLVENSIRESFVEKVIAAGAFLKPGDPLDPTTRIGAIISNKQLTRVMGYIDAGRKQGARLRLGGERVSLESGGYYLAPTIFDNVQSHMTIAQEEIFGPVLAVLGFDSEDEALCIANDSTYGLGAAVWTGNISRAHRMAKRLRAGTVWINAYEEGDATVPFGGFKQSGFGRDKSLHAIDKYTDLKTTWIHIDPLTQADKNFLQDPQSSL